MGRMRFGESLISELLKNGKPICPPPPPSKLVPITAVRRSAPIAVSCGNTERNVSSPTKKKRKTLVISSESESRRNSESESRSSNESGSQSSSESESRSSNESKSQSGSESESHVNNESESRMSSKSESHSGSESDDALVEEADSGLLSRLNQYPSKILKKNNRSSRLSQRKTLEAESVKKILISALTSKDNLDVESMIDKANEAFASLSSLNYDFAHLYDVVRKYISYKCQLLETKKELESQGSMQEMIDRQNNLLSRSNDEIQALIGAKTSLAKARESTASLETWVRETRDLLKELEEKLAQGNSEIETLQEQCDELEVTYLVTKSEQQKVSKEMEENQNSVLEIRARCDEAKDGIGSSKALLVSLR